MKIIGCLLIIGFIVVLWYLSNVMNKPVLSKMHNYYEDDVQGRSFANILIFFCLILAFILGATILKTNASLTYPQFFNWGFFLFNYFLYIKVYIY